MRKPRQYYTEILPTSSRLNSRYSSTDTHFQMRVTRKPLYTKHFHAISPCGRAQRTCAGTCASRNILQLLMMGRAFFVVCDRPCGRPCDGGQATITLPPCARPPIHVSGCPSSATPSGSLRSPLGLRIPCGGGNKPHAATCARQGVGLSPLACGLFRQPFSLGGRRPLLKGDSGVRQGYAQPPHYFSAGAWFC